MHLNLLAIETLIRLLLATTERFIMSVGSQFPGPDPEAWWYYTVKLQA